MLDRGEFALVVGGDCSVLLGALAGARRFGPLSLFHFDRHSDFRHPGNYDPAVLHSGIAGMSLALSTGRGEETVTAWPGIDGPLVLDADVVQIGERECLDEDFAWPDVNETAFARISVFDAIRIGLSGVDAEVSKFLSRKPAQPLLAASRYRHP